MEVTGIISAIIVGLVIGVLARALLPGRQDIPIWLTVVVGIIAALIGSAIVGSLRDTKGIDWIEILVQVILAAVGIAIVSGARSRRSLV